MTTRARPRCSGTRSRTRRAPTGDWTPCYAGATRFDALTIALATALAARAAAQVATGTGEPGLARGTVVERVPCAGLADQSYALYLPSTYSADRAWPILYAFDPGAQGARPVRLAVAAAERFGWIVAGSNNSRNGPMPEVQAAVNAILDDTGRRFAIDSRRVYATGLSGGARVAARLALACRGCMAGVFAQSAGLPVGLPGTPALDFAWFASAGERDMNYAELFLLEQELARRGTRQRLRVFAGGHEWAPAEVWTEALEWFELLAMNDGRRPRDPTLAASLFEKASARAAAFESRGDALNEERELAFIARDFATVADTAPAQRRLKELEASSAFRKALDQERKAIDEQRRVTSELQRDLARLSESSDEHAEIVLRANQAASEIRRGLASAKDPGRRLVYERSLSESYIGAMEAARGAARQQETESALELYGIAAALRPEAPQPLLGRAQAQAAAGRKQDAVHSLRRAVALGASPAELSRLVETTDAFAKLRDDPELRALLAAPPPQP